MRLWVKKSDTEAAVIPQPIRPVPPLASGLAVPKVPGEQYAHANFAEELFRRRWAFLKESIWAPTGFGEELIQFAVFAGAFYLAYIGSTARLWLPDAVLLCALLFTPPRRWWLFLLAPLALRYAATGVPDLPVWLVPANYLNDVLKAVIGASVLKWLNNGPPKLATITELLQFFVIVVVVTPALSAFGGAATGLSLGRDFWASWQIWFLGDALANLIVTPMIIYWIVEGAPDLRSAGRWRLLEAVLLFGALGALGYAATSGEAGALGHSPVLINLTFPLLLYAAVRFGPRGVSTAFFTATLFVIWNTKLGYGPFATRSSDADILWIQLIFYVVSMPLLCIAVLLRQSDRSEKSARESQRRAEKMSRRLIHLQEEERRRIASELHDGIGQHLTLIKIYADTCMNDVANPRNLVKQLYEITATAAQASKEVGEIAHNLRPFELDLFGLVRAIEMIVKRLGVSASIKISAKLDPIDKLLSPETETGVYRIIQEALNNVIKHSNATEASVKITRTGSGVEIVVEDDGDGMEVNLIQARGKGFGLSGIAERVRIMGGKLNIDSSPGRGTRLVVLLDAIGKQAEYNSN